jgi:hypothetical protein
MATYEVIQPTVDEVEVTPDGTITTNLRALLNKASEFDKHMGAYHDGYVTTEDIETEDEIRNTNRTESD